MATVTRSDIIEKLNAWFGGTLTAQDIHRWASEMVSDGELEVDDADGPNGFSAARESMLELEMLDINLVTEDDVPFFVEFLHTEPGSFEAGYIKFVASLQQIDCVSRVPALRKVEPYKSHLLDA